MTHKQSSIRWHSHCRNRLLLPVISIQPPKLIHTCWIKNCLINSVCRLSTSCRIWSRNSSMASITMFLINCVWNGCSVELAAPATTSELGPASGGVIVAASSRPGSLGLSLEHSTDFGISFGWVLTWLLLLVTACAPLFGESTGVILFTSDDDEAEVWLVEAINEIWISRMLH